MFFSLPSSLTSALCTVSVFFFLHLWHFSRMTLKLRFLQCIYQLLGLLPVFTYVLPVSWHLDSALSLIFFFFCLDFFFYFFLFSLLFVTSCFEIPFAFFFSHSAGVCIGYQPTFCWSHVYAPLSYILLYFPFSFALGPLIALERLYNCPFFLFFVLFYFPFGQNPSVFFWLLFFSA